MNNFLKDFFEVKIQHIKTIKYITNKRLEFTLNKYNELQEKLTNPDIVSNIEEVKSSSGNTCTGTVVAYKDDKKYSYEVCLVCDGYKSSGKYCKNDDGEVVTAKMIMTGKKAISQTSYDVNKSYDETEYSNENIEVTFSTTNAKVSKYIIVNTCSLGVFTMSLMHSIFMNL